MIPDVSVHPGETVDGLVFDIKKFAIHDGPGIRTTVFLKGCPLHCRWCHNPESQAARAELSFSPEKCIGCAACSDVCPQACLTPAGCDRLCCVGCGSCAEVCPPQARELVGRRITVTEVLAEVSKDLVFYQTSGGGMTVSGGEPLYQPEFTQALLVAAKQAGISTCLDTSGFASWLVLRDMLPFVDLLLYDLKETDPERHCEYTGVPLTPILENLKLADQTGTEIILRCPVIPDLNDRVEHADRISDIARSLRNLREIDLMAYHPLGESKQLRFGRQPELSGSFADKESLEPFRARIAQGCSVAVVFS